MHTAQDWSEEGYLSQEAQEHILTIANPVTHTGVRKALLATLGKTLNSKQDDWKVTFEPTTVTRRTNKRRKETVRTFLMFMTPKPNDGPKTFLGAPPLSRYTFRVSMKLPVITFPIGDGTTSEDNAFLSDFSIRAAAATWAISAIIEKSQRDSLTWSRNWSISQRNNSNLSTSADYKEAYP
jgi:hypothetical protein